MPGVLESLLPNSDYNVREGNIARMYERSRKAREARLVQLAGATGTPGNPTISPPARPPGWVGQQPSGIAGLLGAAQVRPRWQDALTQILGSAAPPPPGGVVLPPVPGPLISSPVGATLLGAGTTVPNFNLGQRGRRTVAQQSSYNFLSGFNP